MLLLLLSCASPEPDCPLWFSDLDQDGYGTGHGVQSCEALPSRTEQNGDCDDRDSSTHPGAEDAPLDGLDQDCDGQDRCEGPLHVGELEYVDCSTGLLYVVRDSATSWPEGDCICELNGSLSLSAKAAGNLQGGLVKVTGNVRITSGWDGVGLEGLVTVGGILELDLAAQADADLNALQELSELHMHSQGAAAAQMESLRTAEEVTLDGPISLRAGQLQALGYIRIERAEVSVLDLPALLQVDMLRAEGGQFISPKLERLGSTRLSETEVAWDSLNHVDWLDVYPNTSVFLPALQTTYGLSVQGSLYAPKLQILPSLSLSDGGSVSLPGLRILNGVWLNEAALTLPLVHDLTSAGLDSNASLSVPLVQSIKDLNVRDSSLNAPLLKDIESLSLYQLEEQSFNAPKLATVEFLVLETAQSFPVLHTLGTLQTRAAADFPVLQQATTITAYDPLTAPKLRDAQSVILYGQGHDLSDLRWVTTLWTQDCQAFGGLARIDGWVTSSCDLDLRSLHTFAGPLQLNPVGTATRFTLPDPLPTALWLDGSNYGDLDQDSVEGALSVQVRASAPAQDFAVREVGGQLYLELDKATGLGSLEQIETVGGDLSFCAPLIPDPEISAWLTTLSVGGEIIDRCP